MKGPGCRAAGAAQQVLVCSGISVRHLPWVLTESVLYRAVLTGVGLPASPHSGDKCYSSTFCRETKHSLLLKSDSMNVPFVV